MTARHYIAEKVGTRVSLRAKSELYRNILQQEVGFFDQNKVRFAFLHLKIC